MVVEFRVANSDPLRSMDDIDKTVVIVLVMVKVGRKVARVDPDIGRFLNRHHVAVLRQHLGALQVADDDVRLAEDREANASKT